MEFLSELLRQYGLLGIIGAIFFVALLWVAAYRTAKPGTEVSVLWGLIKQTKPGDTNHSFSLPSPPAQTDVSAEAASLLGSVRSTPAGLWLAAEGVTAELDSLLQIARQIKPEYRAGALAHSTLGLMAFNRPKDAREVSKASLSIASEMRDRAHSYVYTKMAENFFDAGLSSQAQQAIELAVEKAQSSKHPEDFRRLTQIYARVFSTNKASDLARSISIPKSKVEALKSVIAQCIEVDAKDKAAGLIEETLEASESISGFNDRAHTFFDLACDWMRIGRYQDGAVLAKRANVEAQKISPQELFAELTKKTIANDANLMSNHPMTILKAAVAQGNPYILTYIARFMPKRGHDIEQIAREAARLAYQFRQSDALADAARMLHEAGLKNEALQAAQQAMDLALGAANPKYRDAPLRKVAEIFADYEHYEDALSAAAGISAAKIEIESATQVMARSYSRLGSIPSLSFDLLRRFISICKTLNDKDRSAALMQISSGLAYLSRLEMSIQTAREAPLSGHRLAAYSIFWMQSKLQSLSSAQVSKIHKSGGEILEKLLLSIFGWDVAD